MQQSKEWQAAYDIIEVLEGAQHEAYIVGGAVRDTLLGKKVHDVDVTTSATPYEVKALFTATVDVGIEHGTVLVIHPLSAIEVTTFRTDGEYRDHRRPNEVTFVRSLSEDLARRDFTINAMALTRQHQVIDLFHGQQDIKKGIIRAVGDAHARFSEDALRMLRAVRFAAQLRFVIAPITKQAIKDCAHDLTHIAVERIKMELDKAMLGDMGIAVQLLQETTLDHYLTGQWLVEQWRGFQIDEAQLGWAYFCYCNEPEVASILAAYRFSNKEKQFIKDVLAATHQRITDGYTVMDYYQYSERVLLGAAKIAYHRFKIPVESDKIKNNKSNLPLKNRQALAVTGYDLQVWCNKKPGKWLKEALNDIERAVLYGDVLNDKQQIKEWYCNDINER